jgi:hypothetical protein
MGHGIVHDQGPRRRETVILSLRFLENDIVFKFNVTTFLDRCRCLTLFDKSADDPQKCHMKKRCMHTVEPVQGVPLWAHQVYSRKKTS